MELVAAITGDDAAHAFIFWSVVVCLVYLGIVYALDVLLVVFALMEHVARSRERRSEDFDTVESSRFTIPVSVIVPVHNEEPVVVAVVRSLLALRYPHFEIIVVNDGSTDGTMARLREEFELEPREFFYRPSVPGGDVARTYRSAADTRLLVVENASAGGKARALNTGLNFSRYRYVCCVDGDTIYFPDALLHGMRVALRAPDRVIGVTSQVAVAERPEERRGFTRRRGIDAGALAIFQHIEYLRAFLNDRLAWSRLGFMLCSSGAFMIWRRDVLIELGGFSERFSCEDIEVTFRAHERYLAEGKPYEIVALPEPVAWTEAPARLSNLIAQRERWHRVVLETVWHYRHMMLRRRYAAVGMLGMPFYVVSEVVAPVFEVLALLSLAAAVAVGLFTPQDYLLLIGTFAFALGLFSAAAILLDDRTSGTYRLRDLVRLLVLAPAELVLYRPVLVWSRLLAIWRFARGEKHWRKFERNPRLVQPVP